MSIPLKVGSIPPVPRDDRHDLSAPRQPPSAHLVGSLSPSEQRALHELLRRHDLSPSQRLALHELTQRQGAAHDAEIARNRSINRKAARKPDYLQQLITATENTEDAM